MRFWTSTLDLQLSKLPKLFSKALLGRLSYFTSSSTSSGLPRTSPQLRCKYLDTLACQRYAQYYLSVGSCLPAKDPGPHAVHLLQKPELGRVHSKIGEEPESSICLAPFDRLCVIEGLGECREVYGQSHGHEYMEDLVRLAPEIENSGTPSFRNACLMVGFLHQSHFHRMM